MSRASAMLARYRPWIGAGVLALAVFLLYRALAPYRPEEVLAAVADISMRQIAVALAFTGASFLTLSASDALAVRYAGKRLPYPKIALASFTSVSIGHLLGFAALSSGALRYRFYSRWGLSSGDVGRVLLFCGTTVALGIMTLAGAASLAASHRLAGLFGLEADLLVVIGALSLTAVAGYLLLAATVRRSVRVRRFELPAPSLALALGQVAVGTTDLLLVSAVLHRMVAASAEVEYLSITAAYVTANVASVLAHVPGGLGVIEAVVVSVAPGAEVVGALIAFRVVYYLLPFAIGCMTLAAAELHRSRSN